MFHHLVVMIDISVISYVVFVFADVIQGHDPLDSTTIRGAISPVTLNEEGSIQGLRIGIPKVRQDQGFTDL